VVVDADHHVTTSAPGALPAERLAETRWLDGPARRIAEVGTRPRGDLAELARGTPLGHPVHPALTDLPIGFWTSAFLLDFVGGRRAAAAARTLIGAGVLSAVPTVASGIADFAGLGHVKRRVAVVHAGANAAATSLYLASWWARRRSRWRGVIIGLAGATLATAGGYLGGWLAFGEENPAPPAKQPRAGQI
jgi:uncharacterized membrane protein